MNCDCIKRIEGEILKKPWQGRKILSASLQCMIVFRHPIRTYTSSTVTASLEGRKREVNISVAHSYCPFCGVKTEIEDGEETKSKPKI